MKTRSPYAKLLADPLFRKRIVKSQKGKGSYSRKNIKKNCSEQG
jgi:stalled ribosome alternative rescue factor ArfA